MNIQHVQFPLALGAGGGFKTCLKTALGRALLPLLPARSAQLERGEVGKQLDLRDRLLIAALIERHERAGTLEKLNGLHDWLWASEQAVHFHDQAQARFDSWWREQHSAIVQPLLQELGDRAGSYTTLCEIGCGSGLILEDMASRLPQLRRFVGLDLSAAQTERNRKRYADQPRLSFETGDAASWVRQHADAGWIFMTNAGVLEYFPEAKLRELLSHIAHERRPTAFAMVEPIDRGFDLARDTASRVYGPERSWSHNYPQLFRQSGFELRWHKELEVGGLRWLLLFARA